MIEYHVRFNDNLSALLDPMANKPPKMYFFDLAGASGDSQNIFVDSIHWLLLFLADSRWLRWREHLRW